MLRSCLAALLVSSVPVVHAQATVEDFAARRADALLQLSGSLLVVPARADAKTLTESGLRQADDFYYLTGIEHALRGLLVLDGTLGESHLFVPPPDGAPLPGLALAPGPETAARHQLDGASLWDDFPDFIDARLATQPDLELRIQEQAPLIRSSFPDAPPGMASLFELATAQRHAFAARWPDASVTDGGNLLWSLRSIKRPEEVETIRKASRSSVAAVRAVLESIAPGQTQRQAEATVIAACLNSGADGIAWWPWVMSGPNAAFPRTFESFSTYRHLNRTMQTGELARVDVGCAADHYTSDVGRTVPVSGTWTDDQREAWDLLVAAYRAGLVVIRDGVQPEQIRDAFRAEVRSRQPDLVTSLGRQTASALLNDDTGLSWHLHHVGINPSERSAGAAPLRTGMVIAYEPMVTVDGFGFYLEDLLRITDDGYELLTPGLPTTADEIELAMQ
ncbi:MAG: aminopeptidase P family protein [Rubricoccaceae bacterium]